MISPSPTAPEGSVLSLPYYEPSLFTPTSSILCRNTAPLVSFAFSLIKRNVGCRVLGREIGQGLVTLIKKLGASNVSDLETRLDLYLQRETRKFLAKGDEASAEAIRDRVSCIRIFIESLSESSRSLDSLFSKISSLFSDDASSLLTLSTVHKAKGLEWPTVFILDFDLYMPSKYARLPWQVEQEYNLIYVAITRAKLDLRYIRSGTWKTKDEAKPYFNPLTDQD